MKYEPQVLNSEELFEMIQRDNIISAPDLRMEIGLTDGNDDILEPSAYWLVSWPEHVTGSQPRYNGDATYMQYDTQEQAERNVES